MAEPTTTALIAGLALKYGGQLGGVAGDTHNLIETNRYLKKAQKNLEGVQEQGATSTLTPELQEAMRLAISEYSEAKERAKYGFTESQQNAFNQSLNKAQSNSIIAAGEAGGGQAARYMGAIGANNRTESLLDLMSKNATLKMQKEQVASSALNPVISTASAVQDVNDNDITRYDKLLREAGKAVSDLRLQRRGDRTSVYNSVGKFLSNIGGGMIGGQFSGLGREAGGEGAVGGDDEEIEN